MKRASQIMYLIARIFNIIEVVAFLAMVIVGIVLLANSGTAPEEAKAAAIASGATLLAVGAIFLIIAVIVLILLYKAYNAVTGDTHEKKPHIIMIVLGAFSENVFLLLGGIFGLIAG